MFFSVFARLTRKQHYLPITRHRAVETFTIADIATMKMKIITLIEKH